MPSIPTGPGPHLAQAKVDGWTAHLRSIQGQVRQRLEDAWAIETDALLGGRQVHAFAVFDGLGGMPRGQEAAWEAAASLRSALADSMAPSNVLAGLNERVLATRGSTTAVIAIVVPDEPERLTLLTVGDSSAYRLHGTTARRVNPLDSTGPTTLTDFLGNRSMGGHAIPLDLMPGESVLLCTDGVDGVVDPPELDRVLKASEEETEAALARLVAQADDIGSPDNATALILRRSRQG